MLRLYKYTVRRGYYENARRGDYGPGVRGPDFLVDGLGEFEHITHVEVKNPVGSEIAKGSHQKGSIPRQGRNIGRKFVYQQDIWSNRAQAESLIENLDPAAPFAKSPNNVLGLMDLFDVPSSEKAPMEGSVFKSSQNSPNVVFLNNN